MRRLLAGLVLGGIVVFGASAAYAAGSYPPAGPTGGIDPSASACGSTVTVTGENWLPSSTVNIALDGAAIRTVSTDGTGSFSAQIKVPSPVSLGGHTVTFSGLSSTSTPENVSTAFTVTTCATVASATTSSGSSGSLAFTGSNISLYVGAAIALILLGLMLTVTTARRHRTRLEA